MNTGHTETRTTDRAFIDALRVALGLKPLYFNGTEGPDTSGLQWFFRHDHDGNRRFRSHHRVMR